VREGLDDGDGAAVGELAGEHELEALLHAGLEQRDRAEHVLHGVAEAEAVALAVVHQGGGAGPGVGDERVVGVPHVDHVVELLVGRLDLEVGERGVPGGLEFLQLGFAAGAVAKLGDGLLAVAAHGAEAEHHDELARLAGGEDEIGLLAADDVVAFGEEIGALALHDDLGRGVAAVGAEEFFTHGLDAGERGAGERHPGAVATGQILAVEIEVRVAGDTEDAVLQRGPRDEERVLEVGEVLERVPEIGEFAVGEDRQLALLLGGVGHLEAPVLEGLAERHEVRGLGRDAGVLALHDRVGHAVAALRLVLVEGLGDGLPGGRPEIAGGFVAQVKLAARLVHRDAVETHPQEATGGAALVERIAAGVVGDDGAILRRTEVV